MEQRIIKKLTDPKYEPKMLKPATIAGFMHKFCGPDGTRTRDLRRDRAAF
jgi:hypothetical protein